MIPNHALNATQEWAYGVTNWFEAGFYVPWAIDKDGKLSFTVTREFNGQTVTAKYNGKVEGDTIKGKMETTRGDGQTRERIWRYLMFRETPRLGATDFAFFVRRDLASGP